PRPRRSLLRRRRHTPAGWRERRCRGRRRTASVGSGRGWAGGRARLGSSEHRPFGNGSEVRGGVGCSGVLSPFNTFTTDLLYLEDARVAHPAHSPDAL